MNFFKDRKNNEWCLRVDVGTIQSIRQDLGIDILDAQEFYRRVLCDYVTMANVLWILVADQAATRGVDAKGFGSLLVGEILDSGKEALTREYYDFFPSREREVIKQLVEKAEMIRQKILTMGLEEISGISPDVEAAKLLGGVSSGSS